VAIANGTLQARIQADHAATLGEEVWLAIAPDRIHLFDPETQAAL
jgi:multiple sugar transport system ATP-binding protein